MPNVLALLPRRILIGLVRVYRLVLSPWLGGACRFEPTCSAYAMEALDQHGAAAGTYLTVHRILRCNPLCAAGHDPVPGRAPSLFRHFSSGEVSRAGMSPSSSKPEPTP